MNTTLAYVGSFEGNALDAAFRYGITGEQYYFLEVNDHVKVEVLGESLQGMVDLLELTRGRILVREGDSEWR